MTIRMGFIGASGIGRAHLKVCCEVPGMKPVATADVTLERAQEAADAFNVGKAYGSHHELLADEEVDAVMIAAPTKFHAPIAVDALKAGKHVLLEKPPATDLAGVDAMIKARDESGKIIACCYQRRHEPTHQIAFQKLREGAIGKIYHAKVFWINARFNPEQGKPCYQWTTRGAAMGSLGGHYLDLAWWMCDRPKPLKVTAYAHTAFCETVVDEDPGDDMMNALIEFEGGLTMMIEATRRLHDVRRTGAVIYGMEGAYNGETGVIFRAEQVKNGEHGPDHEEKIGDISTIDPLLQKQMAAFGAALRGEAPVIIPLEEARMFQSMMDAIYKSAATGEQVVL